MITTPWNHIEAALSYSQGLPLLVIVANGVRTEGLLEPGHDWFVQRIDPKANALQSPEFNGILADWKLKLSNVKSSPSAPYELEKMSIGEIIFALKPKVLWGIIGGGYNNYCWELYSRCKTHRLNFVDTDVKKVEI